MLFSFVNVSPAAAEETPPPDLSGWTQGTGTRFELPDSPYLPVTLDSSVSVTLIFSSVLEIVDITIDNDGITLDGAGFQFSAPGNYAVYSWGFNNVTIENLNVVNSDYGIVASYDFGNVVKNNTVSGTYSYGIVVYIYAKNSTVSGNSVSGANIWGIVAGYLYSSNNIISGNTMSNNYYLEFRAQDVIGP